MGATEKHQHIKNLTTYPWTGQVVENFYNPASSWHHECTLAERFNKRSKTLSSFINSFSWGETPQGGRYWGDLSSTLI